MVREKEIFFKNILQIVDIFVIAIAFFLTFYLMGHIRSTFDLGEMAFAPSFDYGQGFPEKERMNLMQKIADHFKKYKFVESIELIP